MTGDDSTIPSTSPKPISDIAAELGILPDELELYGRSKAKVGFAAQERLRSRPNGRLIYVTAMTATPAGEGKTVTSIGLTQAFAQLDKAAILCLREPSLGPTFGIKGGAAGGGRSHLIPMDEINLHFTGDIHAVGSAHNLLAAAIDNHIHHGNALNIDPRRVLWRRVMDMNDRQLRSIVVGLGGPTGGVPRESGFDITVASEVMAILCLADGLNDLKERLGRMLVAYTYDGSPVYTREIGVHGAMTALLKDAMKPNLVQTREGQPALVHGGPFANIAHGNNSVAATRLALKLGDYVVTEGGFASDLGAEKFFDIVHGYSGLTPDVAVLVCSVRSLNMHGGAPRGEEGQTNLEALTKGLANLDHHIANVRQYGLPLVVAINHFPTDEDAELSLIQQHCAEIGVPVAVSRVYAQGGSGGIELAQRVLETLAGEDRNFKPLYDWKTPIKEKLRIIATQVYGADDVQFTAQAEASIKQFTSLGYGALPVCVAKTQHSLSDNPALKGAPTGWTLTIREVRASLGAGFLVCLAGDMMTMPGLPAAPAALRIDIDESGNITNLV